MIVQADDVADVVVRVEATGGIGEEHGLHAEEFADARSKGDGFHFVAFVETVEKEKVNERMWT